MAEWLHGYLVNFVFVIFIRLLISLGSNVLKEWNTDNTDFKNLNYNSFIIFMIPYLI